MTTDMTSDDDARARADAGSPAKADDDLPDDPHLAALDALAERLAGFGVEAPAEWIDGYLTAVECTRRRIADDEWIERAFDGEFGRVFADPHDADPARAVLAAHRARIAAALDPEAIDDDPEALRLAPLMQVWDDDARAELRRERPDDDWSELDLALLQTGALWASGFLEAIDAFADDWPEPDDGADDAEWHDGSIAAIGALLLAPDDLATYARGAYARPSRDGGAPATGAVPDRDALIDDACFAAQDLRMYWIEHAPRPQPIRAEKTPGRNDPCPCGSGRKWKKCHGAPT